MEKDSCAVEPLTPADSLDSARFVPANQAILASLPLFKDIPFHLLEPFFLKCEYRRLQCRELLLSPEHANSYLYVLLSGQLTIHIDYLESESGFHVQPGEIIGEVSVIDGRVPMAYVVASQDSLLLCIHEAVLWSDFFQIPGAARNMLRQVAGRMRDRNIPILKALEQTYTAGAY